MIGKKKSVRVVLNPGSSIFGNIGSVTMTDGTPAKRNTIDVVANTKLSKRIKKRIVWNDQNDKNVAKEKRKKSNKVATYNNESDAYGGGRLTIPPMYLGTWEIPPEKMGHLTPGSMWLISCATIIRTDTGHSMPVITLITPNRKGGGQQSRIAIYVSSATFEERKLNESTFTNDINFSTIRVTRHVFMIDGCNYIVPNVEHIQPM